MVRSRDFNLTMHSETHQSFLGMLQTPGLLTSTSFSRPSSRFLLKFQKAVSLNLVGKRHLGA